MSNVRVLPNQSLFDIAVRHLGSAEGVFELARINGLTITSELQAGQVLQLNEVGDPRVVQNFVQERIDPGSSLESGYSEPQGIGYWIIGQNFIVQ